jgi:hypothetical protein
MEPVMVLHQLPLPIATLGDIEPLGLELWVCCWRCKDERHLPIGPVLAGRLFVSIGNQYYYTPPPQPGRPAAPWGR